MPWWRSTTARAGWPPQIEQAVKDALGFTIQVTEILPHHVMRDIMYPIYSHKYRYLLQVTVTDMPMIRFRSISNVLTPLISLQAQILNVFTSLPAGRARL